MEDLWTFADGEAIPVSSSSEGEVAFHISVNTPALTQGHCYMLPQEVTRRRLGPGRSEERSSQKQKHLPYRSALPAACTET